MRRVPKRSNALAFTLIELLVVVAIIALLIAILLPSLSMARGQARRVACLANFHDIYTACVTYASDYRDHFPDKDTLGNYTFRRGPLEKDPKDVNSLTEGYGLPSLMAGVHVTSKGDLSFGTPIIRMHSGLWICPDARDWMRAYKNTYCWSVASTIRDYVYYSKKVGIEKQGGRLSTIWWMWDNYQSLPWAPRQNGGTAGGAYTVPAKMQYVPHSYTKLWTTSKVHNCLYIDGHTSAVHATQP